MFNMIQTLTPSGWKDYELIDTGDGEKMERFGAYILRRPEPQALWRKSLPEKDWEKMGGNPSYIKQRMDKEWGDRMQELVIIGQDLDQKLITKELENCLLTEEEILKMKSGILFSDNWPKFE